MLTGEAPGLPMLEALSVDDRPDLMRARVGQALAEHPGISGIYSIGAGNRGLIETLQARHGPAPLRGDARVDSDNARRGLEAGLVDAVIDQKPAQEVALAIDVMKAIADGRDWTDPTRDITPTIFLQDNLPAASPAPIPVIEETTFAPVFQ